MIVRVEPSRVRTLLDRAYRAAAVLSVAAFSLVTASADHAGLAAFRTKIRPILEEFCYDCHGDGMNKGEVAFDQFRSGEAVLDERELWLKALKNLRAGLMPPPKKPRPTPVQKEQIEAWIKDAVFQIDPWNPDPGRVTVRRLNRVEYRNTIRDLMGVDFNTEGVFPPDDSGHGFDNISDALTLPPMLLEKYMAAAGIIVDKAIPGSEGASGEGHRSESNRFLTRKVPASTTERRAYAGEILGAFVHRAYRRPVDATTLDRLVDLAEAVYADGSSPFESGIKQAMVAVLASPRFLFREEGVAQTLDRPAGAANGYPLIDEYALASRLSYFLWSSMPDDQLLELASRKELRKNLASELKRMLADRKSESFFRDFTGQWLQTRDVEHVQIDVRQVLGREQPPDPEQERKRQRLRELRRKEDAALTPEEKSEREALRATLFDGRARQPAVELTGALRRAMRLETEKTFEYIVREDRSLNQLLDSDYTFLNERLAAHYGLTNLGVKGESMRLVKLPPGSVRGGVLTHAAVLAVTSNPTRTSPVKRGLFILENLLGSPPAPPPPDIPPLEEAARVKERTPTLRETLALHRAQPLCSSCHNRMDPLGLALENFNALGMWREQERGQPIDAAGTLLTGESFSRISELKRILVENHELEFYRTLTEKLLTYALGRGLEYYDVATVDQIVERLVEAAGRPSALLRGLVDSAPFQKTRTTEPLEEPNSSVTVTAAPP